MTTRGKTFARVLRIALAGSALAAVGAIACGCTTGAGRRSEAPAAGTAAPALVAVESGFLPDYSRLKPSERSASVRMYRDDAHLKGGFRKLLVQPVQVWRSADRELDTIPEADLHHIADALYRAMLERLRDSFQLVDKPGPGVLEIAMALTLVLEPKGKVDFVAADVPVPKHVQRSAVMGGPTLDFVHDCAVEIEFAESVPAAAKGTAAKPAKPKRIVRAAFFDDRRGSQSPKGSVKNWADLDAVFGKWAVELDSELVALHD